MNVEWRHHRPWKCGVSHGGRGSCLERGGPSREDPWPLPGTRKLSSHQDPRAVMCTSPFAPGFLHLPSGDAALGPRHPLGSARRLWPKGGPLQQKLLPCWCLKPIMSLELIARKDVCYAALSSDRGEHRWQKCPLCLGTRCREINGPSPQ